MIHIIPKFNFMPWLNEITPGEGGSLSKLGLKPDAPPEAAEAYAKYRAAQEDCPEICFLYWLNNDESVEYSPIHKCGLKPDAPPEAVEVYEKYCAMREEAVRRGRRVHL